ncbi:SGNH/GDSL hydrolase family protein [Paenibacillus endoradicis]|uniref:SGNH/GDSL hydrolase family protein n=1 Tax=Paenibacillus endoradicis TaxID=2972487 RepID=UPI002158A308|nr:SGNH/GDSL hydrolase family protein [Paenibacillus endoradicis]MCR8656974.1 SGNH/GDSL hydrolase family protein [Paenibacillus endoradicis]
MSDKQKVVMFQGDSITDGGRPREWEGLGSSYPHLIAGRVGADLANQSPTFYNRGISGNRVSDMNARWNEDTFYYKPDVISILIGVNDAWRIVSNEPKGTTDRFERHYDALLAETTEVLPATTLILLEPFVLKTGSTVEGWDHWMSIIPTYQVKVREFADKYNAIFVPLQGVFDQACKHADASFWLNDGVHPTAAGHALIADQWLSIVKQSAITHLFQK